MFREVRIDQDPAAIEEMTRKAGGAMATPTVLIGDEVIVGYDPRKIEAALAKIAAGGAKGGGRP